MSNIDSAIEKFNDEHEIHVHQELKPMRDPNELTSGLTKREHFAAMAMQGLVVRDNFCDEMDIVSRMAVWSVACADALLAELEK